MWRQLFLVAVSSVFISAIKVPIHVEDVKPSLASSGQSDKQEESNKSSVVQPVNENKPESYFIPPNVDQPTEVLGDVIAPASFLLPPIEQTQGFYLPANQHGSQSEWLPMAQVLPSVPLDSLLHQQHQIETIPILPFNVQQQFIQHPSNLRGSKVLERERFLVPVPSTKLEPPLETAQDYYFLSPPAEELQLPAEDAKSKPFETATALSEHPSKDKETSEHDQDDRVHYKPKPAKPTLALTLVPPKVESPDKRIPTKLYPKKYAQEFKPVPIPIRQFVENPAPKTKYNNEIDDKRIYLIKQAEEKRKLKEQNEAEKYKEDDEYVEEEETAPASEQEASESFRHTGQNSYSAPSRPPPPRAPLRAAAPPPAPTGDRTEFRMHGMKGPHSYQFGYDTGKGKNRQFRYEERDNNGHVRGHYGYMDRHGKLRVVNYDADPQHGFRAEPEQEDNNDQ